MASISFLFSFLYFFLASFLFVFYFFLSSSSSFWLLLLLLLVYFMAISLVTVLKEVSEMSALRVPPGVVLNVFMSIMALRISMSSSRISLCSVVGAGAAAAELRGGGFHCVLCSCNGKGRKKRGKKRGVGLGSGLYLRYFADLVVDKKPAVGVLAGATRHLRLRRTKKNEQRRRREDRGEREQTKR